MVQDERSRRTVSEWSGFLDDADWFGSFADAVGQGRSLLLGWRGCGWSGDLGRLGFEVGSHGVDELRLSDTAASKADAEKRRRRIGTNLAHAVDGDADCFAVAHGSVHVFVHGSVLGDVEEVVGSALHVKEDDDEEKGGD